MVYINSHGYLERRTNSKKGSGQQSSKRNWWLVKEKNIPIGLILINNKYIGKRIRIKVEIKEIKDNKYK